MKFKHISATLIILIFNLMGCNKSSLIDVAHASEPDAKKILIDASKDGGVWWFPQSIQTGFSSSADHQGKYLADYLRSLGYQVNELGRGNVIKDDLLKQYGKVIRAGGFGDYTDAELVAYDTFLNRKTSLMLLQDHLKNFPNDNLSEHLGVHFTGIVNGIVTEFAHHPITEGVKSLDYIGGSVVINSDKNSDMKILGSFSRFNSYDSITGPSVMGILNNHSSSKIFFLGDINGMEMVPQPLVNNLVQWLFE